MWQSKVLSPSLQCNDVCFYYWSGNEYSAVSSGLSIHATYFSKHHNTRLLYFRHKHNAFYGFGYLLSLFCKWGLVIRIRCGAYYEAWRVGEFGYGGEIYEVSEV
jgi:hypothetical protein